MSYAASHIEAKGERLWFRYNYDLTMNVSSVWMPFLAPPAPLAHELVEYAKFEMKERNDFIQ